MPDGPQATADKEGKSLMAFFGITLPRVVPSRREGRAAVTSRTSTERRAIATSTFATVRDVYGEHRMFELPEACFFCLTCYSPAAGREVVDPVGLDFTLVSNGINILNVTPLLRHGSSGLVRDDSAIVPRSWAKLTRPGTE